MAAIAAFASAPALALADLQVNANGFDRVVASASHGATCDVEQLTGGTSIDCPDGSRGTLLFYRHDDETPVCEIDFWYGMGDSGAQQWRAQTPQQNGTYGTCALRWPYANVLQVTLQPAP